MFTRKPKNDDGMEMSILKGDVEENIEEIEYKDFKWKDPFTKTKYIRQLCPSQTLRASTDNA